MQKKFVAEDIQQRSLPVLFLAIFDLYWPLGCANRPTNYAIVIPVQFRSKWGVLTPGCKNPIFGPFWPLLTTIWPQLTSTDHYVAPIDLKVDLFSWSPFNFRQNEGCWPLFAKIPFWPFVDPYWPLGGPNWPKSTFFVIPVQFPSKWGVLTPVYKNPIFDLFWPLLTTRWPQMP